MMDILYTPLKWQCGMRYPETNWDNYIFTRCTGDDTLQLSSTQPPMTATITYLTWSYSCTSIFFLIYLNSY